MDSGRGASITRPDNVEDREVAYMGGRILTEELALQGSSRTPVWVREWWVGEVVTN